MIVKKSVALLKNNFQHRKNTVKTDEIALNKNQTPLHLKKTYVFY